MASATPPLSVIFQDISDVQAVNIAAAGALAWLVYDIFLTFHLELAMIKEGKLSLTKVLYFFIRYYTVFTLGINLGVNTSTTVPFHGWFWYIGFNGPVLSTAIGDYLLLTRVNALYGRNRTIIILTSFLYFAQTSVSIAFSAIQLSSINVLPRTPATPVPGCVATAPPQIKLSLAAWIVTLVAASILFALSLYKFALSITCFEQGVTFTDISKARRFMPMMALFIRDNSFYFLFAFTLQILNLVFIVVLADRPIEQMGTAWLMAGYAVMSSRLVLNMRNIPSIAVIEYYELNSTAVHARASGSYPMPEFNHPNTQTAVFSETG